MNFLKTSGILKYQIKCCSQLNTKDFDGVVYVGNSIDVLPQDLSPLKSYLQIMFVNDAVFKTKGGLIPTGEEIPGKKLIYIPLGPLNRDYDDVRSFSEASYKGITRAIESGCKSPLLICLHDEEYPNSQLVAILGALQALYVPLEVRERKNIALEKSIKVNDIGVWGFNLNKVLRKASILESGRWICRDIGGSDPERMCPIKIENYLSELFKNSCIRMKVISDENELQKEYPLFQLVNRGSLAERHKGRVIILEYEGKNNVDKTVYLVGKGVTYDTGGHDIKTDGHMAGMHRDKCGAAAVAGFFQILSELKPQGIKVVGALAVVRNSISSEAYVADELVTARSGMVIRIGNTDAEGRMAMADLVCQELALKEINPHIITIATLTGHACLAYGNGYTAVLHNGPAILEKIDEIIAICGHQMAEPIEKSTIRREDYKFNQGKSEYEDILQCNNISSSRTPRGHQIPTAFIIMASGMDHHGNDSKQPIKFSHFDIAPSSGSFPGIPTGFPILTLSDFFLSSDF